VPVRRVPWADSKRPQAKALATSAARGNTKPAQDRRRAWTASEASTKVSDWRCHEPKKTFI